MTAPSLCLFIIRVINKIAVPRGGHWSVVLDDGSQVWLNCESTLKFPHCFDRGRRVVELEGEAYFRIAKDEGRPFIVQTRDYDIEVTGTEFNVNSYSPNSTSTTLVEGGVKIELDGAANILTPGCRAVMTGNGIMVEEVEVDWYSTGTATSSSTAKHRSIR